MIDNGAASRPERGAALEGFESTHVDDKETR